MLESLLLTLSLSVDVVCLPYDHRVIDVAELFTDYICGEAGIS